VFTQLQHSNYGGREGGREREGREGGREREEGKRGRRV
jgi:hypothetical protein